MTEMPIGMGSVHLEDLDRGQVLHGMHSGPVSLVDVAWHDPDAVTVTFKETAGGLGQQLLYRSDEERLRIETPQARWSFDADPAEFRLAAEALRRFDRFGQDKAVLGANVTSQLG